MREGALPCQSHQLGRGEVGSRSLQLADDEHDGVSCGELRQRAGDRVEQLRLRSPLEDIGDEHGEIAVPGVLAL